MLGESSAALVDVHDLVMLDLDGVVYVGPDAVPGAPDAVRRLQKSGAHVAYVTNNAARTPEEVAAHLTRIGVPAGPADVVTAAQAAARLLATRLGTGGRVFLAGGAGVEAALTAEGLVPVTDPTAKVEAVATGFGPDLPWLRIVQAAVLIRSGIPWVASNADATFPTDLGEAPGHGALVELLARFSDVTPVVAGKPHPPLFDETIRRVGGLRPLVVGDRLDTDIEGARRAGLPSLLVLTGVTGLAELARAVPAARPTYLGADLSALFRPHPAPEFTGSSGGTHGGWRGEVVDRRLRLDGAGPPDAWWRLVVSLAWAHLDRTGDPLDISGVEQPAADRPASVVP